jgi:hypothetical protein
MGRQQALESARKCAHLLKEQFQVQRVIVFGSVVGAVLMQECPPPVIPPSRGRNWKEGVPPASGQARRLRSQGSGIAQTQ